MPEDKNKITLTKELVSAIANIIDQRKLTYIALETGPHTTEFNIKVCPLCGALIGDSLIHARVHLGPDMQTALLNAIWPDTPEQEVNKE